MFQQFQEHHQRHPTKMKNSTPTSLLTIRGTGLNIHQALKDYELLVTGKSSKKETSLRHSRPS